MMFNVNYQEKYRSQRKGQKQTESGFCLSRHGSARQGAVGHDSGTKTRNESLVVKAKGRKEVGRDRVWTDWI